MSFEKNETSNLDFFPFIKYQRKMKRRIYDCCNIQDGVLTKRSILDVAAVLDPPLGSSSRKQKCLICILDCLICILEYGSKMERFQKTINCWKLRPFVARHFVRNVAGFLNLPLTRLTLLLCFIIYSNTGANVKSKTVL